MVKLKEGFFKYESLQDGLFDSEKRIFARDYDGKLISGMFCSDLVDEKNKTLRVSVYHEDDDHFVISAPGCIEGIGFHLGEDSYGASGNNRLPTVKVRKSSISLDKVIVKDQLTLQFRSKDPKYP